PWPVSRPLPRPTVHASPPSSRAGLSPVVREPEAQNEDDSRLEVISLQARGSSSLCASGGPRLLRSPHRAKTLHVFAQQLRQVARPQVILVLQVQMQDLALAVRLDSRLHAELLDLAQVELPFLAQEAAIERVRGLRAKLRPRSADSGDTERDRQAIVPVDFNL